MVNGRLVKMGRASMRYVAAQVVLQWVALAAHIALVAGVALVVDALLTGRVTMGFALPSVVGALSCLAVRFAATRAAAHMSFLASHGVKDTLRRALFARSHSGFAAGFAFKHAIGRLAERHKHARCGCQCRTRRLFQAPSGILHQRVKKRPHSYLQSSNFSSSRFQATEGEKRTTVRAGISITSPVAGLRPLRP